MRASALAKASPSAPKTSTALEEEATEMEAAFALADGSDGSGRVSGGAGAGAGGDAGIGEDGACFSSCSGVGDCGGDAAREVGWWASSCEANGG